MEYTGFRQLDVQQQLIDNIYDKGQVEIWNSRLALHPNLYLELKSSANEKNTVLARVDSTGKIVKRLTPMEVSGIKPRNREQAFALDALINDEITVVALTGMAGTGKAQPLDSNVLTPVGWKRMGDLKVGEFICTPDGKGVRILGIYPQGIKDIYRVVFQDGSSAECCLDHLWFTRTQLDRDTKKEGSIKSLKEIKETLRVGTLKKRNHSIPMINENLNFPLKEVPIEPYLLGILLGDGSISVGVPTISTADKEILEYINRSLEPYEMYVKYTNYGYDYRLIHKKKPSWLIGNFIKKQLKALGLWGKKSDSKFIPKEYIINNIEIRLALLRGLMDSDGTVDKKGTDVSFSSSSLQLAKDVQQIVMSLGGKAKITDKIPTYTYLGKKKNGSRSYRVWISMPPEINPFLLKRKANLICPRSKYKPTRYIDRVEYVGKKEAQCIYIEHPEHLYITDNYIVTHNTVLALAAAFSKMKDKVYDKIILTRPMSEVGKYKLGSLPGDANEKFSPYLLNYMTNLECFINPKYARDMLNQNKFEIVPLQLMRGASFHNCFILADEMQVCDYMEILTVGTRIGEGSKIVIMGDLNQRDSNITREKTGLYKLFSDKRARESPLMVALELQKCERSKTAMFFAQIFNE